MARRLNRGFGLVAAAAATLLGAWPAPAAADVSEPAGACAVTATWGGVDLDSATASPTDVIEVPRADEVAWSARVSGPAEGTERPVAGSIALVLPAPFGTATLDDWSGSTGKVETSGVAELPDVLPAGVVFDVRVEHYENGSLFCTASMRLRIEGGPGPIAWGGLALTLLLVGAMALLSIKGGCSFAMRLLGAVLGLLAGVLAGSDLVLFGVVALKSIAVVLLAVAGIITGSFLCKFRRVRLRRKKKDDSQKESGGQATARLGA